MNRGLVLAAVVVAVVVVGVPLAVKLTAGEGPGSAMTRDPAKRPLLDADLLAGTRWSLGDTTVTFRSGGLLEGVRADGSRAEGTWRVQGGRVLMTLEAERLEAVIEGEELYYQGEAAHKQE